MTTLEKIRAEIRKMLDRERDFTSENARVQALALVWVLELIDKYAEQEPTSPCDVVEPAKIKAMQELINESYYKGFIDGKEEGLREAKQEPSENHEDKPHSLLDAYYRMRAEQEPSRDIKEIAEIMKCDANAETKCKMISNILTAKPHYFVEQVPCEDKMYFEYMRGFDKGRESVQPCEDAISRQAVLDIVNNPLNIRLDEIIKKLPPVRPQEQTGHWINHILSIECSCCGNKLFADDENENCEDYDAIDDLGYKYCPNCGAEMKGGAE